MDAIRAHLAGFTETVASLGTSLTDEQASLVKRFTDLCYIAYDSDGAGREASIRGMYILQRGGVEVRVISLPEGCDPDDLLLKDGGPETFESLIKKALPLPLYHVFIRRADMRIPGKQRAAREDVLSGLASLPALDVQPHIPKIAEAFGILQHKLEGEIDLRRRSAKNTKSVFYAEGIEEDSSVYINGGENNNGERGAERTTDLECAVCSLLWRDEDLRSGLSAADVVPLLSDEAVINAIAALLSGEPPEALEMRWMALGERKCPERIARGDAILTEGMLGLEHFEKLMKTLGERAIKKRYDQLKQKLLYGEAEKEEIVLYNELAKKLKANTKARTRVS
jgi:DNA primase